MSVYQHWNKLKTCMIGRSYSPEFYSWIKNPKARSAMEKIAQETEEDYQKLNQLLQSFDVDTIRPTVSNDHEESYIKFYNRYQNPPMVPRDHIGTFGNKTIVRMSNNNIKNYYNAIKDENWPDIDSIDDLLELPNSIINELKSNFNLDNELKNINKERELERKAQQCYTDTLTNNNIKHECYTGPIVMDNASVCRVGKDLYYPNKNNHTINDIKNVLGDDYRINFYNGNGHADSCFCPVVPGLIVSLNGYLEYQETFPDWEVVELPNQSWSKVRPFLDLKKKNAGKWWVPGEEGNTALINCVEDWLDNWVGYVEETVFDINMLVIDEKNVVVNNENKQVFDAFERYGITPHVCNFRHRYFWDGGIHCVTADLERQGQMEDLFPQRNEH